MAQNKSKANKPNGTGSIRIIAGKYRGRKLPVIWAKGLRPTTDRVKETVFNWLMPYLHQSRCLDCFAGSGGLGFEALSRGAETVTLLELNRQAAQQLNSNKALIKAENLNIEQVDTLDFLTKTPSLYDIVFIDPPFNQDIVSKTIMLLDKGWLAPDALVYVEVEINAVISFPENWDLIKEKKAGQVHYRLYQVAS